MRGVPPFQHIELWLIFSTTHAGVGKVELNGPGASKFPVGQRVVATPWPIMSGNGTWQQYIVIPESVLYAVPDTVSDEAAAQFLVNPVTVYGFLEVNLEPSILGIAWLPVSCIFLIAGNKSLMLCDS